MIETQFPLKTKDRAEAIRAWWSAFAGHEDDLNAAFKGESENAIDVTAFMDEHFAPMHIDLCWEFGPGQSKSHRLAIAPEVNRAMYPLARWILSQAPECKHFEFCLNRPPSEWDIYKGYTDSRMSWKSPEGITFKAETGDFNLIDLTFYTLPQHQDDRTFDNCFIMAESLLGEDVMDQWIGAVELEESQSGGLFKRFSKPKPNEAHIPVSRLRETVAECISTVKNGLPKTPLFELAADGEWLMMKCSPKEAEDYARMDDIFVMPVFDQGPGPALYSGQRRFASTRFSACDEDFIFVKMDGSADDVKHHKFEDRGEMQDAIDAELGKAALGGSIGGATGQRYSYIFLAVTDLAKAVPIIRSTLQNGRLTRRSWIMFNEHTREQEWIGIWDDTPEPLLPAV